MDDGFVSNGSLANDRSFLWGMMLTKLLVSICFFFFFEKSDVSYQSVAVLVNLFLEYGTIFGAACGVNFLNMSSPRANLKKYSELR